MKHRPSGFTLVELLVTVTIIAALGTVGFAGVRSVRERAKTVVEVNAARNLITAYLGNAAENNGQVLPGYKEDPDATDLDGHPLGYPANARYPFRLAPSVPKVGGVMFCNGNESLLEESNSTYMVSLRPNLGINANLVGGFFKGDSLLDPGSPRIITAYGKFYLSALAEADEPGKLIVFASAREGGALPGYFQVQPPKMTGNVWSSARFSKDGKAASHGYVDFRWGGKAVTAMLGGNVELLDETRLRDMRRWSHQAARANDPEHVIRAAR